MSQELIQSSNAQPLFEYGQSSACFFKIAATSSVLPMGIGEGLESTQQDQKQTKRLSLSFSITN